jgi:hypothetical protein
MGRFFRRSKGGGSKVQFEISWIQFTIWASRKKMQVDMDLLFRDEIKI